MSGAYKRGRRWWIRYKDEHGAARREPSACSTRAQAERLASEMDLRAERIRRGLEAPAAKAPLFGVVAEARLAATKGQKSWNSTEGRFRLHILPALAAKTLAEITPGDVDALLAAKREEGYSARQLRHLRVQIGAVYRYATRKLKQYTGPNPVHDSEKIRPPKVFPRSLRAEDMHRLMEAADRDWLLIKTGLLTGLRKGELAGLSVSDVDAEHRVILVRRSYDRDTTKGGQPRVVAIHGDLLEDITAAVAGKSGAALLFPAADGKMRPYNFNAVRVLREALSAAGLDTSYTFKDLRSTWGTIAYERTGDLRFVQKSLGHADIATTEEHYAALRPEHLLAQVARMDLPRPEHNGSTGGNGMDSTTVTTPGTSFRIRSPTLYPIELRAPAETPSTSPSEAATAEHNGTNGAAQTEHMPVDRAAKQPPVWVRFWSQVHLGLNGACWEWTGRRDEGGYGKIGIGGGSYRAHRVAWALEHGPVPPDRVVRHLCNNPGCVRVDHLALGTHADNVADRVAAGRSAAGSRNGRAKLMEADVVEIRRAALAGEGPAALARRFGVDRHAIRFIVDGEKWKHVPMPLVDDDPSGYLARAQASGLKVLAGGRP